MSVKSEIFPEGEIDIKLLTRYSRGITVARAIIYVYSAFCLTAAFPIENNELLSGKMFFLVFGLVFLLLGLLSIKRALLPIVLSTLMAIYFLIDRAPLFFGIGMDFTDLIIIVFDLILIFLMARGAVFAKKRRRLLNATN